MKKLTLAFLIVVALAVAASAASLTATIKSVSGTAEWRRGTGAWQPLRAGMTIQEGDEVFTGPSGRVVLQMLTGTITVNPLSRVKLEQNIQVQNTAATTLGVQLGNVRALVDHSRPGQQSITVNTPVGSAGIRGSEVDVNYSPDMGAEIEQLAGWAVVEDQYGRESLNTAGQGSELNSEGELAGALETAQDGALPTSAPEGTTADELAALATAGDPALASLDAGGATEFGEESGLEEAVEEMAAIAGSWYYCEESGLWYYYDPETGQMIYENGTIYPY